MIDNAQLMKDYNSTKQFGRVARKYGFVTKSGNPSISQLLKYVALHGLVQNDKPTTAPNIKNLLQPITQSKYILCIDESGSTRCISKNITDGVNIFVNNVFKQDKDAIVTLIPFGSRKPLITVTKYNWTEYKHTYYFDTPLYNTIQRALNNIDSNYQNTIIIFTDGEVTDSGHELNQTQLNKYIHNIVFVGTGEHFARNLGIQEANILTFEASTNGTITAFDTIVVAATERTDRIKKGIDVSKDGFFATKTDMAEMLRKSANKDITVCFLKRLDDKQLKINIQEIDKYFDSCISKSNKIIRQDLDAILTTKIATKREERILTGKHDGTRDEFGNYNFIEYNSKTPKQPFRLVNPQEILWIEIDGKRYNKK